MRVTDSLFYQNSTNSYQDSLKKLYDVNAQMSSGSKIQNSYEDSSIYVDTMRLNNEISTLSQVKKSSSKAQTFANNTDESMNQFSDTLTKFKAKLIQAANATNSPTSLEAIANDLSAMRDHLVSVANTSIDGEFLFSGSAMDVKPVNSDGSYNGNEQSMTSLVGSDVKLPYNVDGNSLFLGKDSDYKKIVSTNVKMYSDVDKTKILKPSDTIEDLMLNNGGGTTQSTAYFYIQGKNSDGSSFKNKLGINTADTVDSLLSGIKDSFMPSDSVNVSLNSSGQIEIEDKTNGKQSLDFSMVASYTDNTDVDSLSNVVSFVKSGFNPSPDASSENVSFDRNYFTVSGNKLTSNVSQVDKTDNSYATAKTLLVDGSGVSSLDGKTLDLKLDNINGASNNNVQIDFHAAGSTFSLDGGTTNYNIYAADGSVVDANKMTYQQLNDVVSMIVSNNIPTTNDKSGYDTAVVNSRDSVDVSLDYRGRVEIKDKTNPSTKIKFSMYDSVSDDFSSTTGNSLSFMSNNSIAIDEPSVDLFKDLDKMISAVRDGKFSMDSTKGNPRNPGIENSLLRIDHISDHIEKLHTKIGSYSNALQNASDRADFLSINVKTIRSQVADVDIGEAYMKFTQISNSYQATLSTIAKINSMSLLKYM